MYLSCDDMELLEQNNMPFILSTMGCSQDFTLTDEKSLVEELPSIPNGGAVATLASTGYSSYITGSKFFNEVYSRLFQEKEKPLGEIILEVKNVIYDENTRVDDMTRRYTLLGDPALKIPFDLITRTGKPQLNAGTNYALLNNYPNPFNSSTTIQYTLDDFSHVEITVFDIQGRIIKTLKNEFQPAGLYKVNWNGENDLHNPVSSGQYLIKFKTDKFQKTIKIVFLK